MIKNYIKIAWRNIVNQRLYSVITIMGLAIGLSVCIMIMLYVGHEMSFDSFHKNAKQIYTVRQRMQFGNATFNLSGFTHATGPIVKQLDNQVSGYTRTYKHYSTVIVENPLNAEAKFVEDNLLFVEKDFFDFFSFKLLKGNEQTALIKPFTVVLSENAAKKYFGNDEAVGKTIEIKIDSAYTYTVTGVAQNTPSNSTIKYDFIASNESLRSMGKRARAFEDQSFGEGSFKTYFLLTPGADTARFRQSLQQLADKKVPEGKAHVMLSALTDLHLNPEFNDSITKYLKIFPFVAALILLLALVNYVSLSTARATLRAKEIGVRKITGATRKGLFLQFYLESALYALLAFGLAYALCCLTARWFIAQLHLNIDYSFFYSPLLTYSLLALFLITVLLVGIYPSFVLSALKPATTLKGSGDKSSGGYLVRKVFTTLQFTIAVALIICGVVIHRQLVFLKNTDTGLNKENVISIFMPPSFGYNYQAFKNDIRSLAEVKEISTARRSLYDAAYDFSAITTSNPEDKLTITEMDVDPQFVSTLGIKWKNEPISYKDALSSHWAIINETAAKQAGLKANPIGSIIKVGQSDIRVAGVVKDFNYQSLQTPIKPLAMYIRPAEIKGWGGAAGYVFVRVKPNANMPALISKIGADYKKYDKETPFEYDFLDEAFEAQFQAEDRLASIFTFFTCIAVSLALLGLFGLTAFTIQQRVKEIGIRKVLGASTASINNLLSADFLKLVILAIVIASPMAWWAMHSWLQNFVYRIEVPWWVFILAAVVAVVVSMLTVSYNAVKAALANPVKSLRNE